jgi:hypothetical protein
MPIKGETPQTDWPTIHIPGDDPQDLVVRWSLLAQWHCSRLGVPLKDLVRIVTEQRPESLFVISQAFEAAVAENFPRGGAPDAEAWVRRISSLAEATAKFAEVYGVILKAVLKVLPAAKSPTAETATTGTPPLN